MRNNYGAYTYQSSCNLHHFLGQHSHDIRIIMRELYHENAFQPILWLKTIESYENDVIIKMEVKEELAPFELNSHSPKNY